MLGGDAGAVEGGISVKRITVNLPAGTVGAFLNYVYVDADGDMMMGTVKLDTKDINARCVTVKSKEE